MGFEIADYAGRVDGMSFAEIERICISAIKSAILARKATLPAHMFEHAIDAEKRRIAIRQRTQS